MKTILRSHELSCPSCVNNIESSLSQAEGVAEATVHFATGRIEITHDSDTIAADELQEMVQKTGYETTISKF